jgi:hypothetical protein
VRPNAMVGKASMGVSYSSDKPQWALMSAS